jgi:hypothetical protein
MNKLKLLALLLAFNVSLGCGSGSNSKSSSALPFSNGQTLAMATSYWTGSCVVTLLNGQPIQETIDFELSNDSGFESVFAGSTCTGNYAIQQQSAQTLTLSIQTSCTESANYVEGLLDPAGSIDSASLEATGMVWLNGNLPFGGNGHDEPCDFALVQGQL